MLLVQPGLRPTAHGAFFTTSSKNLGTRNFRPTLHYHRPKLPADCIGNSSYYSGARIFTGIWLVDCRFPAISFLWKFPIGTEKKWNCNFTRHFRTYPQNFSPQSICAVELRQTLLMFLTRRTAAYLHCRGSGRGKDERNLLTTAMKKEKSTQVLSRLLPELHFFVEPITALRPVRGSWKGFLFLPLCEFLGLLLLVSFFPKSIFLPILFFLFLFPLCLFIIRLLGYRKTRLALCGDFLLVSGCHKFSLFTALIERNHLQSIRVTQNPFQKLSKTCSVRFYVGADRKKYFLIRHFRVSMIENFLFSGDFSF